MPDTLDILNQLSIAVITVNRDRQITFINYAAETLLGYSRAHVVERTFDMLFDEPLFSPETLTNVLEQHQPVTIREIPLKPRGQNKPLRVNVTIAPLEAHEVVMEIELVERILQITKEDQIYSSQTASQSLIRGLAHEIRNPLGGIRGAAQLLEHQLHLDSQKEFTDVIIAEADRLRSLVDRLLGPTYHATDELFNIHEVIERVLKLSGFDERSKKIDLLITRDYDPSVPEVRGEADHILQAVLNIVTNALDALEDTASPKLTVRTKIVRHFTIGKLQHRVCLLVQIENNGPMIPPEFQNQIFLPLISNKSYGSGLGLAIAQNVIQAHGGLISCDSEPSLTRFDIYLPIANNHP